MIIVFSGKTVDAATSSTVNYSVSPIVADNQIDKSIGYYDLKVTPGQKETIKFKINNNDAVDHTYKISVNRAETDQNGVIDYNTHGKKAEKELQYDIEKLVSYPKEVTVSADSSKEVSIQLTAPKGNFSGQLLGGIFVHENGQVQNTGKLPKGVTIKNEYNYVLGLQLQQSTNEVKPDLRLTRAFETNNNGQVSVAAELDNDVPTLERDVSVSARVTPRNSNKVLLSSSKKKMSIAPNTTFDYPTDVNTTIGPSKNKRLKPGTYTMYLNVKANNGNWNLKRNFTVTNKQMAKINKTTPNRSQDIWIILGGIAVLVIIAGSVIFFYRKNKE